MKRLFILILVITFMISLSTGILFSQKGKSKPVEKNANTKAWKRLNGLMTLGEINVTKMGKGMALSLEFQMDKIKEALEKSGIREELSIECHGEGGETLVELGKYKPDKISKMIKGTAGAKSTGHQSKSPEGSKFSSMPSVKQVESSLGKIDKLEKPDSKYKLVFKDSMGNIKATLEVKFNFPHKGLDKKEDRKKEV